MTKIERYYFFASFKEARRAGVTTEDIERAIGNVKGMKVSEWCKVLEDLTVKKRERRC